MGKKVLITIIIIIMILSANVMIVFATAKSELEQENKDLQTKINETEDAIDDVQEELSTTMNQIQQLTSQISEYQYQINELNVELSTLESSIKETEKKLEEAEAKYNKQEEMLQSRLVALYEAGETTYLDVLLTSSDLIEFISNYYLVSEIANYDTELLEQMEKNKTEIQTAKEQLQASKDQIQSVKTNKEATANSLKNSQDTKEEYVSKLSEDEKSLQQQLDEFEEDKRRITNELAEIARKEAASNSGGTIITSNPSNSGYIFPVAGLSKSNINNKSYPSYPGHTGIDVNINVTGKSVVAVKSGTVEISTALRNSSGAYKSYGEYIVINHHDGTMTLYAHLLSGSRTVTKGQTVSQGQVLGIVGSTGNSTGTHLHFEVRVNGYCVNPLSYLP